jgi:hypothetical protein
MIKNTKEYSDLLHKQMMELEEFFKAHKKETKIKNK